MANREETPADWLTPTALAKKWGKHRQQIFRWLDDGVFDSKKYAYERKYVSIKEGKKVIVRLFPPEYKSLDYMPSNKKLTKTPVKKKPK